MTVRIRTHHADGRPLPAARHRAAGPSAASRRPGRDDGSPELRHDFLHHPTLPPDHFDWVVVRRLIDGDGYEGHRDGFTGPTAAEILAAVPRVDIPPDESRLIAEYLGIPRWKLTVARRWSVPIGWVEPDDAQLYLPRVCPIHEAPRAPRKRSA